jgi:hypothetical protein
LKYLSAILHYFDQKDYTNRDNVAIIISDIYENNPKITEREFVRKVQNIKNDFFRLNRIDREKFAKSLFESLTTVIKEQKQKASKFDIAKKFITQCFEIGYNKEKFQAERAIILDRFKNEPKPHPKLINALDKLLSKIEQSYQIGLHGVKEYSGVDLAKKVEGSLIGFQIKTVNDDISEDKIRAQTSKAQEYKLDGFVWLYGRPPSRKVDDSAQAAFHYFMRINEGRTMYTTLVIPDTFAELLRKNNVEF